MLNIVNLGPLDEDLEALTHWLDVVKTLLEFENFFSTLSLII